MKRNIDIIKCTTRELNLRTRRHNPKEGYKRNIKHKGKSYDA